MLRYRGRALAEFSGFDICEHSRRDTPIIDPAVIVEPFILDRYKRIFRMFADILDIHKDFIAVVQRIVNRGAGRDPARPKY